MKNSSLIILAVFVLAAGGVGAYALMSRNTTMTKSDSVAQTQPMVKDETVMLKDETTGTKSDETMMPKDNKYISFSPDGLANSASNRRVLFFYANWCPTCQPADASFTTNTAQIPTDVTVIRVNYNDTQTDQAEKDLAKKYGITYQHTFVQIDAQGNEVTKWNGGQIEELLSNLK